MWLRQAREPLSVGPPPSSTRRGRGRFFDRRSTPLNSPLARGEGRRQSFWERHPEVDSWSENGRTCYRLNRNKGDEWYPNQCVVIGNGEGIEAIVSELTEKQVILRLVTDYVSGRNSVWGIQARNREQNFAMNLLMDPDIDFVTLMGTAGTGKTLLTLATGLAQTLDDKRFTEIIVTRATVSIGEDIGYLPGTEEEKMTPWMGALTDNLEVLTQPGVGGEWGRAATNDLLANRIKVRSLNFMRGRTFFNRLRHDRHFI